jgi:8-oxo-dGTP diphosphatase
MIDPHESPATAVVRETFEETGLEARPVRIFGVFGGPHNEIVYENGDRVSFTAIGFIMAATGGVLKADGEEIERLDWIEERQIDGLGMSPIAEEIVRAAFADHRSDGRNGPYFSAPAFG